MSITDKLACNILYIAAWLEVLDHAQNMLGETVDPDAYEIDPDSVPYFDEFEEFTGPIAAEADLEGLRIVSIEELRAADDDFADLVLSGKVPPGTYTLRGDLPSLNSAADNADIIVEPSDFEIDLNWLMNMSPQDALRWVGDCEPGPESYDYAETSRHTMVFFYDDTDDLGFNVDNFTGRRDVYDKEDRESHWGLAS